MWTWWYNWINELWINYKQNLRAYQPVYKYSKSDERHFHAQYERQNLYSRMLLLLSTLVIRKIVWVTKKKKKKETWMHFQAGQMHLWDLTELEITWHGMVELPHQFISSCFWYIFVSIVDHFFHLRSSVHCQLWLQLVRHERSCNAIFFAF